VSSPNAYDIGSLPEPGPDVPGGGRRSRLVASTGLRREGAKGVAIAVVSTVVVFGAIVWVVVHSKNWPAVKQAFFNGEEFRDSFPEIARKFVRNIEYFLVAEVVILALALLVAVLRSLPGAVFFPLRVMAIIYTDLFRGLPVILLVYLLGFGVPSLDLPGVPHSATFWAVTALVLCYAAYVAEVFRAGIESVHPSQRAAARSLGLTHGQTMRHVILPQGIRRVVPPLLNDLVSLQKDSGLVSILGAIDAVRAAGIETATSFNFTPYVVAGGLFVLLTVPMTRFTDWVSARAARRQSQGGAA